MIDSIDSKVPIVEGEIELASLLANYLHVDGFATASLNDAAGVVDWVRAYRPQLVLLDKR